MCLAKFILLYVTPITIIPLSLLCTLSIVISFKLSKSLYEKLVELYDPESMDNSEWIVLCDIAVRKCDIMYIKYNKVDNTYSITMKDGTKCTLVDIITEGEMWIANTYKHAIRHKDVEYTHSKSKDE